MRVIAVDDEKLSLLKVERILKEIPDIEFVAAYICPMEALQHHKEDMPEVAFLDVEMPEIDGLSLAEQLMEINPNLEVIYVTAHDKYALAAYQANAIGYLLKPVQPDELRAQVSRLKRYTHKNELQQQKLYFKVFGSYYIEIEKNSNNILKFRTAKSEELLAFLLSQNGNPVSRDTICDNLWPDMEIDKATRNFHTTAYNIRHTFQSMGLMNVLLRSHDDYRLNPDCVCSDLEIFTSAKHLMEKGIYDIKIMENALNTYQGRYMAFKDYVWLMEYQSYYERIFEKLSLDLSYFYKRDQKYLKAETVLRRLMNYDVLNEEVCDRIIALYLLTGQNRKAAMEYNNFSRKYFCEMGEEPVALRKKYKNLLK
jgi:Response regulator containing CheY-like receiver and SARP domains